MPEEVGAILQLKSKLVPQINVELAICGADGANESIFEGLDSPFCGVNPVVVGLNQLERDLLWVGVSFYGFCCLVIYHVYLWFKSLAYQIFEV